MALRRFGPGRRSRRRHVYADRHGETQRRRSAGLARRRAHPYRRHAAEPTDRAPAVELEGAICKIGRMSHVDRIARIRIQLDDWQPVIWRRVEVPLTATLKALHDVIQAAMPFDDYH